MPNYASPFLDTQAPAQWATPPAGGGTGATGPVQLTGVGGNVAMNGQGSGYDQNLSAKLAGTIVMALVVVFLLQQSGFRFVVAAGVGG